jgi:hypothetical protein
MRARATTLPSSSAATAFTEVVPISMPTVTKDDGTKDDVCVTVRKYGGLWSDYEPW